MARQYFVETGEPQRAKFIARRQSYHGNTLGALAVGGNEWRRRQFEPLLIDVGRVSPCYEYRDRRDDESPERYSERLAQELEAKIDEIGAAQRDRVRGRDGRGRHDGRRRADAGILQARARDLRPPRNPAHPRRGDVRHGPHRNVARLRAGRRRARPHDRSQGIGRRLPADRRHARVDAHRRGVAARQRHVPAWAHVHRRTRWPHRRRWRCRR